MKRERAEVVRRRVVVAALIAVCGCGGRAAPRAAPAPAPAAVPVEAAPAPASPPDPYRAQLNLDLEQLEGGKVRGWRMLVDGAPADTVPDANAHDGKAGVKLGGAKQLASEDNMSGPVVLRDHFDLVIFVARTTRARPLEAPKSP